MNAGNKMENEYYYSFRFFVVVVALKVIHTIASVFVPSVMLLLAKMTISCTAHNHLSLSLDVTNAIKDDYEADAGKIWCTFEGDQRSHTEMLSARLKANERENINRTRKRKTTPVRFESKRNAQQQLRYFDDDSSVLRAASIVT